MAAPAEAGGDFPSARARTEFILITVSLFLAWSTWSSQALLSVILAGDGYSTGYAGFVIGIGVVPSLLGTFLAGRLMARFRPLAIAIFGFGLLLVSHVALQWVRGEPALLIPCRLVQGAGQGLAVTTMMVAAQRRLTDRRMVYFFGIFTTMLSLPNLIAPPLAELYLARVGLAGFFLVTAVPNLFGILLLIAPLRRETPPPRRQGGGPGYLALLGHRGTRLVLATIPVAGFLWGFVPAFMALVLAGRGLPAWSFFSVMTLAVFAARFGLLAGVHRLPRYLVVTGGMALYGAAYALLALSPTLWGTVLAAIIFGIGHSTAFPVLSIWSSTRFPPAERGRPMALAQFLFSGGSGLAPLIGGAALQLAGTEWVLAILAAAPFAAACAMALRRTPD